MLVIKGNLKIEVKQKTKGGSLILVELLHRIGFLV